MTTLSRRSRALLPLALLIACGGPPTEQMTEAESAIADAILAKKCAPEDYAAAERMYAKAQKLSDEEDYDGAEAAARAAKKLAIKARDKALANRDDCLRPKAEQPPDLSDFAETNPAPPVDADSGGMKTVFFDYNAFELTGEARQTMANNAAWLKRNATAQITVEGHCDKRGSTEFNLALGEKRAKVVKKYLRSLGVQADRLAVISYGEEQPADYGDSEQSFARNRRAEFRVRKR